MALLGAIGWESDRMASCRPAWKCQKLTAKAAINPQAAKAAAMAVAPSRSHRLHLGVVDEGSSTIR
jgi:hypothetical protein